MSKPHTREEAYEAMWKALNKLRYYNIDIQGGRINYRAHDHIAVCDAALDVAADADPRSPLIEQK